VRVALLRRGLDGEEPHDPFTQAAARDAEMAMTVGLECEMTAVPAVAVEADEPAATRALAYPMAMVAGIAPCPSQVMQST
jgi:hypothetical protein